MVKTFSDKVMHLHKLEEQANKMKKARTAKQPIQKNLQGEHEPQTMMASDLNDRRQSDSPSDSSNDSS